LAARREPGQPAQLRGLRAARAAARDADDAVAGLRGAGRDGADRDRDRLSAARPAHPLTRPSRRVIPFPHLPAQETPVHAVFAAIGRFSVRFRWPVLAVWVVGAGLIVGLLPSLASV